MEPLAPGTEDDPLYVQASRPSKKEAVEEQALSKKAILPNGKYDTIFELNYVEGSQHWFCRICECLVLGKLFNHEIGKRHLGNLEKWNWNTDLEGRDASNTAEGGGSETPMVVAPGEPVPPGFEGEIESVTMIQGRLDGFNAGPLVGLEYLLELLDYDPTKEPSYLCILCDKKGDPRTVLTHLSSYNHQVMYLQKHFPTVYRHIAPYMIKAFKRNWQSGLQKIAEAIENTFGRLKPMPVEADKFDKDRMLYIEIVAKGKHFSELSGHTFENVVTKEDLTKVYEEPKPYDSSMPFRKIVPQIVAKRKSPSPPVVARPMKRQRPPPEGLRARKRSLSPVSDISSSDLEDFDPGKTAKVDNRRNDVPPKPPVSEKWNEGWRRSPSPRRKKGPMPWQKANYGRSKQSYPAVASERRRDEKAEKMEEFKKLTKAIDNDMEQVLKKHKLNPEKHPKYNDEWKKFWNLRYKELQAQGKNAATHDFKPEWIEFWNKRMLELHQEEIKMKKMSLRKRLGLPDEATPISFKIGERRKLMEPTGRDNKPLPTAAQPDSDPEVIIIEDNDKDSVRSHSSSSKNRRQSTSPLRKRDRSPQFRRRSPIGRNDSPTLRRRSSPVAPTRRLASPSPNRRPSPPVRRSSPAAQKSTRRMSPSPRRRSIEKNSPPPLKPLPPKRSPRRERSDAKFSPPSRRYSIERSPGPDRFGTSRMRRSKERSKSRGRSRELSWERDRHRDYDDKHSYRLYRSRGGHAPWESPPLSRDRLYAPMLDPYAPPKVMRDVTRQPVHYQVHDKDDNEDVNIVGVLRLLTALEEKLGSLGPKVIDLLAQALAMEKKAANSSEELLDNEMNCVLFETVKEKLKGQLQAGLVDRIQEKAFKIAIKKTASLIHMAGQRKKQKEVEQPKKPVVVPGIGTVDKGKIARQIANALIAQGKTDVTQEELEQLINAVVGIAEAKKNSSQPITTASFLEQMSSGATIENKPDAQIKPTEVSPKKKEENPAPPALTTEQTTRKIEEEQDTSNGSTDKYTMNMEGLSDSDLQTLLQNFKDLSTEEQHGLINYLKKLEAKEPERVEKLRKFVNLTENVEEKNDISGRYSPFSNRSGSLNPAAVEEVMKTEDTSKSEKKEEQSAFVNIDSEDEDYSFEDVAKAASQKVIEKEMEMKRREEETKKENEDKNMNDAKALITTLMNSLNKGTTRLSGVSTNVPATGSLSNVHQNSSIVQQSDGSIAVDGAGISEEAKQSISAGKINIISNVPVSSADLAKSLSGITMSMSSLGSILGNVQNLTRQQAASAVVELEPQTSHNSQPSAKDVPTITKSNVRNLYDDFDIGSQKEVRGSLNFADQQKINRPAKPYDEFNIGPNPGDFRDEVLDPLSRGASRSVPAYGAPQRGYPSYPERSGMTQNVQSLDRSQPYAPPEATFRGNVGGPSPSMSSQSPYPSRGGNPTNNMRPNNFDIRGEFGQDRGDFRGANESRAGIGDFRSGPNDMRGGVNDLRGGVNDLRGGGDARSITRNHGDLRGAPQAELRGGLHGDFRSEYRDGQVDFRGGSDFRASDFRIDSRGPPGNFRGGFDDMRNNSVDTRGGLSRGGAPPMRGMIDPNRLGNSGQSRYSGNYSGNSSNSFKRW